MSTMAAFAYELQPSIEFESEYETTADKRDWYVNEDGVAETQDYFLLPNNDLVPSYIEEIEYLDDEDFYDVTTGSEISSQEDIESLEEIISPAAVTKANESEPNNTYSQANKYQLGSELSGHISSTSDVDYFKLEFLRDGKAKFHLSNIPQNCNYDMKIYSQPKSGGSLTLLKTLSGTQNYELLENYVIDTTKWYYVQIYSSKGYSTSQKYTLTISLTPSDDVYEPNNSFKEARSISSSAYLNASIHKPTDVDFYTVNLKPGVLTAALSSIPRGCDYRMAIYDRNQNLVAETPESGNNDKILSIAVQSGIYFIKIYSKSGFNATSNYKLTLNTRSALTTVNGSVTPQIKTEGNKTEANTPISNLPIKIVYTKKNNATQYILASTTTNSSGAFSASFSLPSDVNQLFVKVYPDSSAVSVQLLDETVYSTLFQIPFTPANITLNLTNQSNITQQFKVSMSLWRFAHLGLSSYKGKGNGRTPKLVVRCTYGKSNGTNATSDRILIAGISQNQDYYDWDIFLHEMGHWIMMNNGGMPNQYGGSHTWSSPSSLGTAYSEGWAHYFSAAMRNNHLVLDYDSNGRYFGGNLSNGQIKPSSSTSSFQKPIIQNPYSENAKMEINVGASLWNLSSENNKSYSSIESIMKRKHNEWQSFYQAYISSLSGSSLEKAWNVCEEFHVAYDLEVPVVSLSISGLTASMRATDNIAVKDYEWYVDGTKRGSGTGSSGTLNLSALNLSSGTHTLECRVYDPEGRASGTRPRALRYGSASQSFNISNGSANRISTICGNIDVSNELNEITEDVVTLNTGDIYDISAFVPNGMDLYVYAETTGAIKTYTLIAPDGEIYEQVDYIAPDCPYIIENAMPGEWKVLAENYSIDEIESISIDHFSDENIVWTDIPPVSLALNLSVRPSKVDILNGLEITNDPYVLSTIFNDENIAIYESGVLLNKETPLSEGLHELELSRIINGFESVSTRFDIIVDTQVPVIICSDIPEVTTRDRFVLTTEFSKDIACMTINGISVDLGLCDTSSYTGCMLLTMGINNFEIVVTDYAGNCSSQQLQVLRIDNV